MEDFSMILTVGDKPFFVTAHALERLKERWPFPDRPKNYLKALRRLLSGARPETVDPAHKVIRLINNRFVEAEYWVNQGIRFVIIRDDELESVLVTVELVAK